MTNRPWALPHGKKFNHLNFIVLALEFLERWPIGSDPSLEHEVFPWLQERNAFDIPPKDDRYEWKEFVGYRDRAIRRLCRACRSAHVRDHRGNKKQEAAAVYYHVDKQRLAVRSIDTRANDLVNELLKTNPWLEKFQELAELMNGYNFRSDDKAKTKRLLDNWNDLQRQAEVHGTFLREEQAARKLLSPPDEVDD